MLIYIYCDHRYVTIVVQVGNTSKVLYNPKMTQVCMYEGFSESDI